MFFRCKYGVSKKLFFAIVIVEIKNINFKIRGLVICGDKVYFRGVNIDE